MSKRVALTSTKNSYNVYSNSLYLPVTFHDLVIIKQRLSVMYRVRCLVQFRSFQTKCALMYKNHEQEYVIVLMHILYTLINMSN